MAKGAFFNSASKDLMMVSLASFLKNTVMAIFSLKSSANFLELIIKSPNIPNKNSTKNTLKTTEK